jgi:membrane glycosyltransferase
MRNVWRLGNFGARLTRAGGDMIVEAIIILFLVTFCALSYAFERFAILGITAIPFFSLVNTTFVYMIGYQQLTT